MCNVLPEQRDAVAGGVQVGIGIFVHATFHQFEPVTTVLGSSRHVPDERVGGVRDPERTREVVGFFPVLGGRDVRYELDRLPCHDTEITDKDIPRLDPVFQHETVSRGIVRHVFNNF
jgi:hypothetical protein